jgi:hypothetical protein
MSWPKRDRCFLRNQGLTGRSGAVGHLMGANRRLLQGRSEVKSTCSERPTDGEVCDRRRSLDLTIKRYMIREINITFEI